MTSASILVIGAGPSGLSVLDAFNNASKKGHPLPKIVCYERAAEPLGQWNTYTWKTGTDEHGLPVHQSQYKHMWANGPKEVYEYPDYTYMDHFGKKTPSFPPRMAICDYLKGKFIHEKFLRFINFNTYVKYVRFIEDKHMFEVRSLNLSTKEEHLESFDYVVVATGHFSTPNMPEFDGMDTFPGSVIHSHNFRDARVYIGKRVLIIGSSYSGDDIAMLIMKFGASSATVSYRTKAPKYNWPSPEIDEKPLVESVKGKCVRFIDGSSSEYDAIILCTGYLHDFPFLERNLHLETTNTLYPPLYKGVVWINNPQLFYVGMQNLFYTFTMLYAQGTYVKDVILDNIRLPEASAMLADMNEWISLLKKCTMETEMIDFQTDYVVNLSKQVKMPYDLNVSAMLHEYFATRKEDMGTYRDKAYPFLPRNWLRYRQLHGGIL